MSAWKVENDATGTSKYIYGPDGLIILFFSPTTSKYNERLVSAAPDLLKFLVALLNDRDHKQGAVNLHRDARALVEFITASTMM